MSLTANVKEFIKSMDEESIEASTQAHIKSLVSKKKRGRGKSMAIGDIKRNTQILN